MAITILPATPSDSAVLTPIGLLAFANDPLNQALVTTTTPTPAQQEEYVQYRIQRNERRMAGPGKSWFKAVDSDTGEVLGYTGILAPEQVKVLGGVVAGSGPANADGPLPEILNREWVDVVEREFGALKKRHLDGREDFWCESFFFWLFAALRCFVFPTQLIFLSFLSALPFMW